jgi:hypothetical protein
VATPSLEKLNAKIKSVGADWVAGETTYSRYYGTRSSTKLLGLALTPELAFSTLQEVRVAEQNLMLAAAPPPPPPASIDWRAHKGKNWVTPIRDQKTCGSCVAFATCATLESRVLIQQNKPGVNFNLSEAHLFYCGAPNSCSLGWQPSLAFAFAKTPGIGLESGFPYTPGDQACQNIPAAVKVAGHRTAGTSLARKRAVAEGPVVAAMAVFDDFLTYRSGIYRHVQGNLRGYHAISIVGYDDTKGCWIAKNSWGTGWGASGFFQIRYGECGIDTQFPFTFPTSVTLQPNVTVP